MSEEVVIQPKRLSGLEALRVAQAEAGKPSLDAMIDAANRAAELIENDQMRFYEWGWNEILDYDAVERAVALRGGARLLELMKFSDQAAMRRLLHAARDRMERISQPQRGATETTGRHDTGLAERAHEAKVGGILT